MSFNYKQSYNFYITENYSNMTSANTVKVNIVDFSFDKQYNLDNIYRDSLDPTASRGLESQLTNIGEVNWTLNTYVLPTIDTNVTSAEEILWKNLVGGAPSSTPSITIFDFADGNIASLPTISLIIEPKNTANKTWVVTGVVDSVEIDLDSDNLIVLSWKGVGVTSADLIEGTAPSVSNYTDRTNILPSFPGKFTTVSLNKYTSVSTHGYTLPIISGRINIKNNVKTFNTPKLGLTSVVSGHWLDYREIAGEVTCYLRSGTGSTEELVKDILIENANNYENGDISITLNSYNGESVVINMPLVKFNFANQDFEDAVTTSFKFIAQETVGNYVTISYNS